MSCRCVDDALKTCSAASCLPPQSNTVFAAPWPQMVTVTGRVALTRFTISGSVTKNVPNPSCRTTGAPVLTAVATWALADKTCGQQGNPTADFTAEAAPLPIHRHLLWVLLYSGPMLRAYHERCHTSVLLLAAPGASDSADKIRQPGWDFSEAE